MDNNNNNTINTIIIDRDIFNNMDMIEQINYINGLLKAGETLNNICTNMPISKKTLRNRFKKGGYIFNKDFKQYIEETQEIMPEIKGQINITDVSNETETPDPKSIADIYIKLEQMQKEINTIKSNNTNNTINASNTNNTNNYDNLDDTLNSRLEQLRGGGGESVSRVYRLNADIQKEFKSLCKKHLGDGINISDIVSLCMLEFIEKYK